MFVGIIWWPQKDSSCNGHNCPTLRQVLHLLQSLHLCHHQQKVRPPCPIFVVTFFPFLSLLISCIYWVQVQESHHWNVTMSDTTANEYYQPASNDSVFCATQPLNEEKIWYLNIHKTSALDAFCLLHCFNTTRARLLCSLRRM